MRFEILRRAAVRAITGATLAATLLVQTGCGDEPDPMGPPAPDTQAPTVPRFEETSCAAPLPSGLVQGENVRCGTLFVRQDRRAADGLVLRLPVMIVRGASDPAPDPIVHLIGGPGGAMEAYGDALGTSFGLALSAAAGRDVVFFDQRGTGKSEPRLDCSTDEELPACVARLAGQGIRVESFNSEESAADVDDLRRALGLERINVYGQSYGTLLAQTVVRRFPASVRTVLLESTSAVAYDALLTSSARSFELVATRIMEECEADPACAAAFPGLADDFAAILTAYPPGSEESVGVLRAIELLMQFAQGTSQVPLLVRSIVANDIPTVQRLAERVQAAAALQAGALGGFSVLTNLAVNCYDYAGLETQAREQEINGDVAEAVRAAFPSKLGAASACAQLPPSYVSPAQQQPVKSDLPTLLLAGTHDTNTPLEVAQLVQRDLSRSHLVARPGWGHVMLAREDRCGLQAYADFLREPTRRPTTPCLATDRTLFSTSAR